MIALLYALTLIWWTNYKYETDKSHLAPKTYDITIINYNKEYSNSAYNSSPPYELPYLKIKSLSFATDEQYLFIKFNLGGTLPTSLDDQPLYQNDKIGSVYYDLTLDENYFDLAGNKNPGGPEAELKINFYGDTPDSKDTRISVQGELLKGGPGKDYFVVRYPYYQLLLNQTDKYVVFSSYALVTSELHPDSASMFVFKNPLLAATPENTEEVKVDLSIKTPSSPTIENAKY